MNKTMTILLCSIDGVKDFVNMVSRIEGDVTISSGRYIIDAKSISGILAWICLRWLLWKLRSGRMNIWKY